MTSLQPCRPLSISLHLDEHQQSCFMLVRTMPIAVGPRSLDCTLKGPIHVELSGQAWLI